MRKKISSNQVARAGKVSTTAEPVATAPAHESKADDQIKADGWIKWRGIYALIPSAFALLVSINTLWNSFASDDGQQVLKNDFIKTFSNIPRAFTSSVWAFTTNDIIFTVDPYYRPLFTSLFTINYALFGTKAWGWHLVNLLIHVLVTWLVFVVIKEATERKWTALIAAVLFAVHPAHAESVAWVSGVTDPLLALFLLPAFYFYMRYRKQGHIYMLAITLGVYFLALLSKEAAIALPVFIAFYELFYFNKSLSLRERAIRFSVLVGLFTVPTLIYFAIRYHAISAFLFGGSPRYPLIFGIATMPLAMVKYLALLLFPVNYSYQHYTPLVETFASLRLLAPLVLLAALVVGIALTRSRVLVFAAVWFAVMLLPVLLTLQQFDPGYLVQERYLYLPSIGICLALALGIEWLATRDWFGAPGRKVALSVGLLLIVVFGAVHIKQNRVWEDSITVYKNCVAVAPQSSVAYTILARVYYDAGRPREAETAALTALDLDSTNINAYMNLSYFSRSAGRADKAIDYLEQAVSAASPGPMTHNDLATAYLNLGLLYRDQKDINRAESSMLKSLDLSPRPVIWYYLGQFYLDQRRFEDAKKMFEMAAAQTPRWFSPIHIKLGQTYESLNQIDQALAQYQKFLEVAPPESPDIKSVQSHIRQLNSNLKAP
ncbi:MAG TPA: tetratricopeptide repeat protein [Blastocatellia bacterium]|nr:tetratricopeptide repeat protein [Blastocatellia bacterium]